MPATDESCLTNGNSKSVVTKLNAIWKYATSTETSYPLIMLTSLSPNAIVNGKNTMTPTPLNSKFISAVLLALSAPPIDAIMAVAHDPTLLPIIM